MVVCRILEEPSQELLDSERITQLDRKLAEPKLQQQERQSETPETLFEPSYLIRKRTKNKPEVGNLKNYKTTIDLSNDNKISIEHILNVAGEKQSLESYDFSKETVEKVKNFDWLNCTRYRPPKLPRQRKREGIQRRKSGRNPRIPFSSSQVAFLETKFLRTPYLSSNDVTQIASFLKLSETRVKIWFQNRRARERREKESKSKAEKNFLKSELDITSHSQTKNLFSLNSSKYFFFDHKNLIGCKTISEPTNYLQVIAPLDLSERQMVCTLK